MHVTLTGKSLSTALITAKPVLAGTTWAHVLLEAAAGGLTLTALNSDATVRVPVGGAVVHRDGACAAPTAQIKEAVGGKASPVDIDVDGFNIRVLNGATTTIRGGDLAPNQRPQTEIVGTPGDPVPVDVAAVGAVVGACSSDQSKPMLCGMLWSADGDLVGTDSYRLYVARGVAPMPYDVILPAAIMQSVAKHATGPVQAVPFLVSRGAEHRCAGVVITDAAGVTWEVRAVEADYPSYRTLIPSPGSCPVAITFPRPAFDDALRSVIAFYKGARTRGNDTVMLSMVDGRLRVAGRYQGEDCIVDLPGDISAPELRIAFAPAFLLDLIAGVDTCRLDALDALKPAVLRTMNDGSTFEHIRVLMPVRASW